MNVQSYVCVYKIGWNSGIQICIYDYIGFIWCTFLCMYVLMYCYICSYCCIHISVYAYNMLLLIII